MSQSKERIVIEPKKASFFYNLKELKRYKELLWTLTYRDFRVKYAQTAIGFAWAVINPIFTLVILTFVFGTVAKVNTHGIPHPLYTIAGMCGWTYFAVVLGSAGTSIIGAQNMVKKIYFPRLVIPLSKAITALIDFFIVLICLGVMMAIYNYTPSKNIIFFPLFLAMAIISGLAAGIWTSALTIRYRDFIHIIPLVLRVGMYATPIAYPSSQVPDKYQLLFHLNPMAGVVEGIRWSILGGEPPNVYSYISFGIIIILFIFGMYYFNKVERVMADII